MNLNDRIIKKIVKNLTPIDDNQLHERYDDYINQTCEEVKIMGLSFIPSEIVKKLDPVAYRCGFNDWLDGEITDGNISEEINGEYYNSEEVEAIIDEIEGK